MDKQIRDIVHNAINEAFASPRLKYALQRAKRYPGFDMHHTNNLKHQALSYKPDVMPFEYRGVNGFGSSDWLDKITDDMIDVVGTEEQLRQQGFRFNDPKLFSNSYDSQVVDADGDKRYAINLRDGKIVILKKTPEVKAKIFQLSNDAAQKVLGREKKARDRRIAQQFNPMSDKAYAAREYRTNPYPWKAKNGDKENSGPSGWNADARARAMDNIRQGKDALGIQPSKYMNYLKNENKEMSKQTVIRLTEGDVRNIVLDSVMEYLNEAYGNNIQQSVTVFINADTQECVSDIGDVVEEGLWFECEVTPTKTHTQNTGIGHYEFWGQPGYDKGNDVSYVDSADVTPVKAFVSEGGEDTEVPLDEVDFNDELKGAVLNYVDNNNLYYNDGF